MDGEELVDDLFGAAFDEAVAPAAEPAAEAKPEPEPEEKPKEEPAPEVKAEPAVPAVPAPITTEDISKVVKEALAAQKPIEPVAPVVEDDVDPPEVLTALKELEEQWPTHKVAVNALVDKALKAQEKKLTEVFTTELKKITEQFAPIVQTVQTSAEEQHFAAITAKHADAQTIIPEVEKWIAEQPKYLQAGMNAVLDGGTAEDVIDLFDRFKAATKPAPAAEPPPKVDDRLNRMEAPATVRTSVTAEAEPNDFDSAFESEAKKYKP